MWLPARGMSKRRITSTSGKAVKVCVKCLCSFSFPRQVEKESVLTTYTENERSMLKYLYDCVFFVVRKPATLLSNSQNCKDGELKISVQETESRMT